MSLAFFSFYFSRVVLYYIEYYLRIIHQFKYLDHLFVTGCESDDESFASSHIGMARGRQNGWSYDLLYNPLSCKTEAFTLVLFLVEDFLPSYSLCRTFRDTRRADAKLLFTYDRLPLTAWLLLQCHWLVHHSAWQHVSLAYPRFIIFPP